MSTISRIYYSMPVNCIYFLVMPVSLMLMVISANPYDLGSLLSVGAGGYTASLTYALLIVLGSITLSRMLLFILRNVLSLKWPSYILWCALEIVVTCLFLSLLFALRAGGDETFFSVMAACTLQFGSLLAIPSAIITLSVRVYDLAHKEAAAVDDATLVRFYDEFRKLRLIVASDAVLFIQAEENYVQIYHLDNGKIRKFTLRSSMRALEENVSRHGIVRCHRSYFVNPVHVRLLRKDGSGSALAELDREGLDSVPVSRKYYDALTALL